MLNYYYKDTIESFLRKDEERILGEISKNNLFGHITTERYAWLNQISILKESLVDKVGQIFFEFSIPRMGKRVDCILIIKNIVFVVEFKVGQKEYLNNDLDQVWDYALDLKNFHEPSHQSLLVPILIATEAKKSFIEIISTSHDDNLIYPIRTNANDLKETFEKVLNFFTEEESIDGELYLQGSYSPTPTIIEAAISLYSNHNVENITRNDAGAINLKATSKYVSETIEYAKTNNKKVICFVTGVPGAGKTLVGLKVATEHLDHEHGNKSVFLSGNQPLVDVLQEALTRDRYYSERSKGNKITKKEIKESVKTFIQIIHHYRDEYLRDKKAPYDHVAIFDEAQRAWTKEQTINFMKRKKDIPDFSYSEPEFLISCLDRHEDWAVVVCLVGGGQEINTGEAGISEWLDAIQTHFVDWETHISPKLFDSEYNAIAAINLLRETRKVSFNENLHLSVSMRSFRAENVSKLIKQILDLDKDGACETLDQLEGKYPIVITRDIIKAKKWLKEKARGSERYGVVVSSQAYRLKPLCIDVRVQTDPVHWFLGEKNDVRSSYYMEDVATEFQVQGLELDWACVTWDGDLRYTVEGWKTYSFVGTKWNNINKEERKKYLINAYRVLLTRARQGMVIVVPEGNLEDHTRKAEFYDCTFEYLKEIGIKEI